MIRHWHKASCGARQRVVAADCCYSAGMLQSLQLLQLDPPVYRAGLNTVSKKVNRVFRVRIKAETMFSYTDL